jgi:membrane protease YdiL (CAAX protease family)
MSSIPSDLPPLPATFTPLPKRGHPLIAWLVIVAAVTVAFVVQLRASRLPENGNRYLSLVQVQGRFYIGMAESSPEMRKLATQQVEDAIKKGPYAQRLRYIVLLGELSGPKEALAELHKVRDFWEQHPPPEEDRKLTELLEFLYRDYQHGDWDAPSLTEEERQDLRQQLEWLGALALAPAKGSDQQARAAVLAEAKQTYQVELGADVVGLLLAAFGLCVLGVGGVMVAAKLIPMRFLRGSRDGGIYAETFALWMVVFMLLQYGSKYLPGGPYHLLLVGLLNLTSLVVLGWPVLRGVTWRRVRQDLGWWTRGPFGLELLWGLGSYLASFPLVFIGLFATTTLMSLYRRLVGEDPFSAPIQPTHPAGEMLQHANWLGVLQLFFLASVCAPIIEETMFRGVFYRHLREVGGRWPRGWSVLFSALVSSFIFAVIHPQGFFGVPVLMGLALGFAMTRELRGSLLGSMAAHGVSNGLVMLVGIWIS